MVDSSCMPISSQYLLVFLLCESVPFALASPIAPLVQEATRRVLLQQ